MENESSKPEYDGQCAFGLSLGREAPGKESAQLTENGKVYYFSNPLVKWMWKIMPNRAQKADAEWANQAAS